MIKIKNLNKIYGKGDAGVKAVKNCNITIENGETVAIIGKSGSGKTTLLNLLGGLDTSDSGSVFYDDTDIIKLKDSELSDFRLNKIGFVFQFFDLLPELTAEENILLPAKLARKKAENFDTVVNKLGIKDRLKHYPSQMSGGQQQRVAIARALINEPDIILCDEPTGNLDAKSGEEVLELLTSLKKTVIIVTHNPEIAEKCSRIIEIADGEIV
jgi:ABC-type lipoprotein export system ATPase subunit